ncbi:unnamed protein product [Bathycoccus prasinos]
MEGTCAEVPLEFQRGVRACLNCKLIKTFEQFLENGCDNCSTLSFTDSNAVVKQTTSNYSGVITVLEPKQSWSARWLHLGMGFLFAYCKEKITLICRISKAWMLYFRTQ